MIFWYNLIQYGNVELLGVSMSELNLSMCNYIRARTQM